MPTTANCDHCYCGTVIINNVNHSSCHKCGDARLFTLRLQPYPVPVYPQPVYPAWPYTQPWYRYATWSGTGSMVGGQASIMNGTSAVSMLAAPIESTARSVA